MSMLYHRLDESPRGQIIKLLQRNGPMGIKDLRQALGVSDTAIRQQLQYLIADDLVVATTAPAKGRGRPGRVYQLTENARHLFACECEDLALALYNELLSEFGPEVVHRLLDRVGQKMASQYKPRMRGLALQERVRMYTRLLDERGIMSEMSEQEDVIVLHEYNCPYHELAAAHGEICEMEQKMLAEVLGADVELTQKIVDGHYHCAFVVKPASESPQEQESVTLQSAT
ncbi:MAG TPA: DeoR family transcriptional regulator [Anaerolineae bacterium]|nr:DeoR family transcriptional regulator [Anaerolineae bacterium]